MAEKQFDSQTGDKEEPEAALDPQSPNWTFYFDEMMSYRTKFLQTQEKLKNKINELNVCQRRLEELTKLVIWDDADINGDVTHDDMMEIRVDCNIYPSVIEGIGYELNQLKQQRNYYYKQYQEYETLVNNWFDIWLSQ